MAGIDGDAGMAAGMTRQRLERNAWRDLIELLSGGEPAPLLALRVVFDNVGFVRPLRGAVANFLPPRRSPDRTERFCGGDVDSGVGEVGHSAGVVHVEMRDDDVAHVISRKAEVIDLVGGSLLAAEDRPDDAPTRAHSLGI